MLEPDAPLQSLAATLNAHPDTARSPIRAIHVQICRMPRGMLTLTYRIEGDMSRVRVPAPRPARIAEHLWQHTCCELFLKREGAAAYHEFNFSPSGEWAAYAFERHREGATLTNEALEPHVTMRSSLQELVLDAAVALERLSPDHAHGALELGISCVVESADGALAYWALAHAPGKPDFHAAQAFALKLDAIRN